MHFRETVLTSKRLTKFRACFHSPDMFKMGIESGTLTFFFLQYLENCSIQLSLVFSLDQSRPRLDRD